MRPAGILILGVGVVAAALGCSHCQYTAGVCDCDPPPVESVLVPYTGRAQSQPTYMTAPGKGEPQTAPPKTIEPLKPPKVIDPGKPPKVVDSPE